MSNDPIEDARDEQYYFELVEDDWSNLRDVPFSQQSPLIVNKAISICAYALEYVNPAIEGYFKFAQHAIILKPSAIEFVKIPYNRLIQSSIQMENWNALFHLIDRELDRDSLYRMHNTVFRALSIDLMNADQLKSEQTDRINELIEHCDRLHIKDQYIESIKHQMMERSLTQTCQRHKFNNSLAL